MCDFVCFLFFPKHTKELKNLTKFILFSCLKHLWELIKFLIIFGSNNEKCFYLVCVCVVILACFSCDFLVRLPAPFSIPNCFSLFFFFIFFLVLSVLVSHYLPVCSFLLFSRLWFCRF